jgi:small subunit ribosomal protein S15
MLDKKTKDKIIQKFRTHPTDTGSSEVQIAILTEEIRLLANHLKMHKKDFSSRRGLLQKVADRRKLLRFLERENLQSFEDLVKKLHLKIARLPQDETKEELLKELEEQQHDELIKEEEVKEKDI